MCFDIEVTKLSLRELRDTLRRISMLLSKPVVVNSLPDKGHQLKQVKEKLIKEINFREGLDRIHKKMQNMLLKCASDTNIDTAHSTRLCSLERRPVRERFRPNLALRPPPSGRTESMKELHSGTKLIDLSSSMNIQKEQEERVKTEQVRAKQEKLLSFLKKLETNAEASEDTVAFNLSDYSTDEQRYQSEDEPGPSGLKKLESVSYEDELDSDDSEVKIKITEPEAEIAPNDNIADIKTENGEPEQHIETNAADKKVESLEPEKEDEASNTQDAGIMESEESEQESQLSAAISDIIAEAIEQKEYLEFKGPTI